MTLTRQAGDHGPMTEQLDDELRRDIAGVAAIALTYCEMGGASDEDVIATIRTYLDRLNRLTVTNVRHVADAIRAVPQPLDRSAEETARARPIEDMLGVTSAEDQLAAQLRAYDLALRTADLLEEQEAAPPEGLP